MKLLFVTQSTIGGTLEYFKLLIPRLAEKGDEITVVCPSDGLMKMELEGMGIKVHIIEMVRKISIVRDARSICHLVRYIKSNDFDIIHTHSSKAGAIGRIAAFLCRTPCIYTAHGWAFSMSAGKLKKMIYICIEKILALLCRRIVAISEFEHNIALQYRIAGSNKLKLISNGIDVNKFAIKPKKNLMKKLLGIKENVFVIGMVGRLAPQKDPLTFVKAAKIIADSGYAAYFILVGDGELRAEVEQKILDLGLSDQFLITGWVENVQDYTNIFDIGVLTSQWEGFGLVLAEYMANRVPVVASNVGGIPDVILDGETGKLVNPCDTLGFAAAIIDLLCNEDLKNKFITSGFERVNLLFSIQRVAQQHHELYMEMSAPGIRVKNT
ncbi:MAG: glycosyltransferase family 4 protein [Oscillospiraceae bacterium]|nr:glycosyltransferase family 4 protein [Oscillospiraceae bacterium]